jgi:hypothetical protein
VTTGGVLGQQVQLITADHFGCRAAGVPRVG